MNRMSLIGAALLLALGTAPAVAADTSGEAQVGDLLITGAWTRATPRGAPTGAAYLTIVNRGSEPDRLVAASSPVSAGAEIHETSMSGSVMKMRHLADGLAVPAGATVELAPGGYHVMLTGLHGPIETGAVVPLTLRFEKAGEVTLEAIAAPIGAPGPS